MKLIRNWTDFTRQLDDFVNHGTEIHSKEREVLTEQDFLQSKNDIEELIKNCRNFLKESFEEDKFQLAESFYYAGRNSYQIPGQKKDWRQLNKELFAGLLERVNTLKYFKRILSVSDAIIKPEIVALTNRNNYTTEQTLELILQKLYDLYDTNYHSIPMILEGNGIKLERHYEDRELGKILEDNGYVKLTHTRETLAQLTLSGKMYIEEKRKTYKESYEDLDKSQDDMNERVDEILEKLKKLGYGQEIIFDEIQELKELYGKLNKKNWGQVVKGKLVDLALAKLVENDTISYIYEKLTNHTLRLP